VAIDDGSRLDLRSVADGRARHQHGAGSQPGVVANAQLAHNQLVPVDPPAMDIDVRLERGAIADGDQAGGRRDRAQPGAVADPVTHEPGIPRCPRGSGQRLEVNELREPLDEPQAGRDPASAGVAPGPQVGEQEPAGDQKHPHSGGDACQHQPAERQPDPPYLQAGVIGADAIEGEDA